jgi:hypothetical protein
MSATKTATFEELLQERERLLSEQAKQLAELENAIRAAARAKGFAWAPLGPSGGKVSPGHASAKSQFHERNRAECIKRGWVKPDGTADLERFRLEKKAESLGISIIEVAKREAAEKAKRAEAKFKTVGKTGKR